MQEYLVPFSILTVSLLLNNYLFKLDNKKLIKYFKISAVIFLIVLATINFSILRNDIINNDFLFNYNNCAQWMKNNIQKTSLVFTNAYAFPYLFLKNSDLIYTHGIDLTYSYLYEPKKFGRYMDILQGKIKEEKDYIIEDYNPDYIFSGKVLQDVQLFEYIIKYKQNYRVVYEDGWCAVLEVK